MKLTKACTKHKLSKELVKEISYYQFVLDRTPKKELVVIELDLDVAVVKRLRQVAKDLNCSVDAVLIGIVSEGTK